MFQFGQHSLPEFDRFDCPIWAGALPRLGKGMRGVLQRIGAEQGWNEPVSARAGDGA